MNNVMTRALGALCLLFASSPFASPAGITIVGNLTQEMTLQPGGRSQGTLLVRNNGADPQQVRIYQTDYLFYADGTNIYGEPGSVQRSNAPWIAFAPHMLTIPGKATAAVNYIVQVPADESLTGTYWSVLMIEPVPRGALEPPQAERDETKLAVWAVLRYAVQFVTHMGRGGQRDLKFASTRLAAQAGEVTLQLDVENTGQTWLRPWLWAEVFDHQGVAVGRFDGQRLRIYPGCSVRFQIDLSSLERGRYDALIVADNGDEHVFGARYGFIIE